MNGVTMNGVTMNSVNINGINNKKFTDLYNKFIKDLESLKSFYFNRYILDLEFGTINFIIGELLISIKNFNNLFNNGSNVSSYSNIIKVKFNNLRLLINKLNLIIGVNFNDGKNNKQNVDEFVCDDNEYNLNFFNTNKENYNTIKIINNKFKIITQNIVDITKNNKLIMDNIQINIIFNKIKGEIDTINNLINYSTASNIGINGGGDSNGSVRIGSNGTDGNGSIVSNGGGSNGGIVSNGGGSNGGSGTGSGGNEGVVMGGGSNGGSGMGGVVTGGSGTGGVVAGGGCNITFKQFCSLNNKKKIKIIIIKIIDIIRKINIIDLFKQLNFVNAIIITFIFLSIYYG